MVRNYNNFTMKTTYYLDFSTLMNLNKGIKKIRVTKTLIYYNFNIIGLSEVNIHWPLVKLADSWEEIISGHWWARNSVMVYNLEDNDTKVWKQGGYLQIGTSQTTHKVLSMWSDMSGLGCCFCIRYQGKHNLALRVINAYIPCITTSSGVQTTYHQHQC